MLKWASMKSQPLVLKHFNLKLMLVPQILTDLAYLKNKLLFWQFLENKVWLYIDYYNIYPACRTSSNKNHLSGWLLLNYDPILLLVPWLPRVPWLSSLGVPWLIVSSVFLGWVITLVVRPGWGIATLVGGIWRDCSITSTCQRKLTFSIALWKYIYSHIYRYKILCISDYRFIG